MNARNPFEDLSLPVGLDFSDETLQMAYDQAAKNAHPDSSMSDGTSDFSSIDQAKQRLTIKSQRIAAWMEIHGIPIENGGRLRDEFIDWFSQISALIQSIQSFQREKSQQRGALAQALHQRRAMHFDHECAQWISKLKGFHERLFSDANQITLEDLNEDASRRLNEARVQMTFLEKWLAELQKCQNSIVLSTIDSSGEG